MKSISDILNSLVQPPEQHSLLGGNQGASAQGTDPSGGSFSDVLSRLNSQNASTANVTPNVVDGGMINTNNQNTGLTANSTSQITVTEVQVTENVLTNSLNSTTLSNVENAVAALTMALAKLVNLASHAQNLNQTQARNLIVSASGGTISAPQAQQLVAQIANLKNQNSGQNALSLTPEQQNALLLQFMQSLIQNQQVTLTQSPDTQNNQSSLSNSPQGSSLLQFSFSGNQSGLTGSGQIESLSIDIQTLNLQVSNDNQQNLAVNTAQTQNLTDATTQKLSQLLQQLNVTPSSTPANIQVQSSVRATNSPELAKNFQNLVQVLTLAGAGQAVLNNFLIQNKNNGANNNLGQIVNQVPQVQNPSSIQSVSVSPVSESESANSAFVSANGQNNSAANQTQLLNDSLAGKNIQLAIQIPQVQNNTPVQTDAFLTNIQNQHTAAITTQTNPTQTTNQTQASLPLTNTQASQVLTGTNVTQNTSVQPMNNQPAATVPAVNVQAPQELAITKTPGQPNNNQPIATIAVVINTAQTTSVQPNNNQSQPTTPATNTQTTQISAANSIATNNDNQSAANPDSQTSLSQPRDVFSNGQLEALNGIVARFNSAVVSGQAVIPNVIDYKNNINLFPSETQAENQILNQAAPVQAVLPVQSAAPIVPTVNPAVNVVLNNQNTQETNNLTSNNVQNQLVQSPSPITQQVTNTINDSAQNLFAQNAVTPTATNINATVETPGLNQTNNSSTAINPPISTTSIAPVTQQIVTANQSTVVVNPSSTSASGAPVTVTASAPVVTQPVTNPASMTAQNIPAATVAGEAAKASVPALVQTSANNNNTPTVSAVPAVSMTSSVQPVTAQSVTQTTNSSETSTNLNTAGNSAKDTLTNTTNLQNLAAAVNAGITTNTDKANTFQNTVNTIANNNPNGSVDSAQIMNQISQQVASQTADAKMVSRLSFQLVPESLGRVTIQVALVDQSISARIMVSNPDVREVLQQHMVDLKAALSQAGLQIDQMQVQVQGGGSNLLAQYYQYQQEGNSYRESAWTPANTPELPQNPDNLGILVSTGSSSLLNFLVYKLFPFKIRLFGGLPLKTFS